MFSTIQNTGGTKVLLPGLVNDNNHLDNLVARVRNLVEFVFSTHWSYTSRGASILKRSLIIVVLKNPALDAQLRRSIGVLGLPSVITIYRTIKGYPSVCKKLWSNSLGDTYHVIKDREAALLSTFSLIIEPLDLFDTFSMALTAANRLGLDYKNAILSRFSLPAAVVLLSLVSLKGAYSVIRQSLFLYNLPGKMTDENKGQLKKTFEAMELSKEEENRLNPLSLNDEGTGSIKDCKRNKLVRKTDEEVVKAVENLLKALKNGDKDESNLLSNLLSDIRTFMIRKIAIGVFSTLASVAAAGVLFNASALSGVIIQTVFVSRSVLFVLRDLYVENLMDHGLDSMKAGLLCPSGELA